MGSINIYGHILLICYRTSQCCRLNGSSILQLCQFECKTAIANIGSNLLSDGVFGGHLSNGTGGVPQNHVQKKFWNIG